MIYVLCPWLSQQQEILHLCRASCASFPISSGLASSRVDCPQELWFSAPTLEVLKTLLAFQSLPLPSSSLARDIQTPSLKLYVIVYTSRRSSGVCGFSADWIPSSAPCVLPWKVLLSLQPRSQVSTIAISFHF